MKKVALIGDSIRLIGYGLKVPELLGEGYTVFQPQDNCRFAKYTLRGFWDWKDGLKDCDVIHWNNGLWDVCELFGDGNFTPIDEYVENMLRIAKLYKQITPNVIFATTTPVRNDNPHNRNSEIERYNAALVPELEKMGIVINDLYGLLSDDLEGNIRGDDKIHLTEKGIDLAAEQVVKFIKELA
ncbi:MAG: SGNH/GDSL hydrolase family protein [Clostridia bacterium]|nr:SGNH/GDSL hydrolase family protein [Clostridia bacterium]